MDSRRSLSRTICGAGVMQFLTFYELIKKYKSTIYTGDMAYMRINSCHTGSVAFCPQLTKGLANLGAANPHTSGYLSLKRDGEIVSGSLSRCIRRLMDARTARCPGLLDSSSQISPEKVKHLFPAVNSGLRPVVGAIDCKEGVSRVFVEMEFVGLAKTLESLLCLCHICR